MGTFFGILIIIFLVLLLFGRYLGPLVQKWMMGKMEDRFRRMAGMPTRKEERKMRREAMKNAAKGNPHAQSGSRRKSGGGMNTNETRHPHSPIIPKEYAEDVEFVEIKSYSEEIRIEGEDTSKKKKEKVVYESQVEDAEFTEIKISERQ